MADRLDPLNNWDTPEWEAQNAGKEASGSMATWRASGFDSQAAYDNAYNQPTAPPPGQAASTTENPNAYSYANDDAFGQYLNTNKDAATASGYITSLLAKYYLDSLAPMVKNLIVSGTTNTDIITQKIYETPEFKAEYPEIAAAQARGNAAPLAPGDIINTRNAYQQALQSVGIQPGFLSKEQMSQMIIDGVSPTEVQDRLTNTVTKIQNDPSLAPQLQRLYGIGVTPGEAAAYFLDPDHTEAYLTKQVTSAGLAARAQSTGFGQLNLSQSENLASLGITDAQAVQGFGTLAQQKGLLDSTASENGTISTDTALSAQFANNGDAQAQLNRRLKERQAAFGGGGNFADPNKSGLTGAGVSNN